jgi:peroxiredoxin
VALLPLCELSVAAALILRSFAWYGACGALALLTAFAIAVGYAMVRGRRPVCHCFGQLHSARIGWATLTRNCVLAAFAAWVLSQGRLHPGPDLLAWLGSLDGHGRKVAIIAGCAAGLGFFYALDRARPGSAAIESRPERPERPEPVRRPAPRPPQPARPARPRMIARGIGLPIGSPAPAFELPGLAGEKRSLQSLRDGGKDILLVFSSPFCDSCVALTSKLASWTREMDGLPSVVLISSGTAQDNRAKLQGFEPSQILLQPGTEVADAYDCSRTPTAVLVGADGAIRSDLAVGGEAIGQLLSSYAGPAPPPC